jgi:hypothetical protein
VAAEAARTAGRMTRMRRLAMTISARVLAVTAVAVRNLLGTAV